MVLAPQGRLTGLYIQSSWWYYKKNGCATIRHFMVKDLSCERQHEQEPYFEPGCQHSRRTEKMSHLVSCIAPCTESEFALVNAQYELSWASQHKTCLKSTQLIVGEERT